MNRDEQICYWVDTSDKDYNAMKNLFNNGDYHWALFISHLILEKLFKALFIVKNIDKPIPKTHDLNLLAQKCNVEISEDIADLLDLFTTFNINSRYPDYKYNFYKLCTKDFTNGKIKELEELRKWLKELIKA